MGELPDCCCAFARECPEAAAHGRQVQRVIDDDQSAVARRCCCSGVTNGLKRNYSSLRQGFRTKREEKEDHDATGEWPLLLHVG